MKQKLPWVLLVVVLVIAIIGQIITYANYSKLHHAVSVFINDSNSAKTEQEFSNSAKHFMEAIKPAIDVSTSKAFLEVDVNQIRRSTQSFFCGGCKDFDGGTCCGNK